MQKEEPGADATPGGYLSERRGNVPIPMTSTKSRRQPAADYTLGLGCHMLSLPTHDRLFRQLQRAEGQPQDAGDTADEAGLMKLLAEARLSRGIRDDPTPSIGRARDSIRSPSEGLKRMSPVCDPDTAAAEISRILKMRGGKPGRQNAPGKCSQNASHQCPQSNGGHGCASPRMYVRR